MKTKKNVIIKISSAKSHITLKPRNQILETKIVYQLVSNDYAHINIPNGIKFSRTYEVKFVEDSLKKFEE